MHKAISFLLSALIATSPLAAFAQDEEEVVTEEAVTEEASEPSTEGAQTKPEEAPPAPPAAVANTAQESQFSIQHGLFAEAQLGVFMTFLGRNTNDPALPKRPTSNVQPGFGLRVGYDVAHGPSYNFALSLNLSMGLNGGLGRVKNDEIVGGAVDPTTKSSDYTVIQATLAPAVSFLLSDRVALTVMLDGGMVLLDPDPTKAAATPPSQGDQPIQGAGGMGTAFSVGGGVGVEYYTLLSDFSIGLRLHFSSIFADGFLPAGFISVPVKYTF